MAVKKKVEEFVTLSDRYITAGFTIHEGLEKRALVMVHTIPESESIARGTALLQK